MEDVLNKPKQYEEPQLIDLDEEVGEVAWLCATGGGAGC